MTLPSDASLTDEAATLRAPQSAQILLVACGAIAREVLAIIEANGWSHIDLQCLPAILHNQPDQIPDAVENLLRNRMNLYTQCFVLYADCGTGGQLKALCDRLGVQMLAGPHCYSFFEGNEVFAKRAEDEFTAFYLTDFLVRQFEAFVVKPLGLDRHPELRDSYFGHYETLIYQAQTRDPALDKKAEECASFLGLRFERRQTGFGDLEREMTGWLNRPDA